MHGKREEARAPTEGRTEEAAAIAEGNSVCDWITLPGTYAPLDQVVAITGRGSSAAIKRRLGAAGVPSDPIHEEERAGEEGEHAV